MAKRVIKTHPKRGTVSRRKIRAAAQAIAKSGVPFRKKGVVRNQDTASGRKQIAFRRAAA